MYLERTYILYCCSNFPRFKQKSTDLYNFSCNICQDSATHKNKARAYIYNKNGEYFFHCHNCNHHTSFKSYLKQTNPQLYEEYLREVLKSRYSENRLSKPLKTLKEKHEKNVFSALPRISELYTNHPAKVYLNTRKLSKNLLKSLYYCENFKEFTNNLLPEKFVDFQYDEQRIIIPLLSRDGRVNGYQGRSLDPKNSIRYITIILADDAPKVYGLDQVDFNRQYFVVEGPFDSTFIPNCIASCGGKITSDLLDCNANLNNAVIIYDNEPRGRDIIKNIRGALDSGFAVCIWPDQLKYKDINDMILSGLSSQNILDIIKSNIYRGLSGHMRLSQWSKI